MHQVFQSIIPANFNKRLFESVYFLWDETLYQKKKGVGEPLILFHSVNTRLNKKALFWGEVKSCIHNSQGEHLLIGQCLYLNSLVPGNFRVFDPWYNHIPLSLFIPIHMSYPLTLLHQMLILITLGLPLFFPQIPLLLLLFSPPDMYIKGQTHFVSQGF